jgi:FtsP/CotA-like multicopper oxidase with cupredoxin domain
VIETTRRSLLLAGVGLASTVLMPLRAAHAENAREFRLRAAPGLRPLLGPDEPETAVWAYDNVVPGPLIRLRQGEPARILVENGLQEDTTVHWHGIRLPQPITMGSVGTTALLANGVVFAMLWAWRDGDANMRSVWICSRNDVVSNLAVLLAVAGVFGIGTGWPDLVVAALMASLALQGAWIVVRQAVLELRSVPLRPAPAE